MYRRQGSRLSPWKRMHQNLEDVRCCLDPHGILVLKAFITRDRWEAERQAEKKVPRAVIYSTRHLPKISQQLSG